jgi:hypothetical protein
MARGFGRTASRRVNEFRFCALLLESDVDRPANRSRPVDGPSRHDKTLPLTKDDLRRGFELDVKLTCDDKEEFIGTRVPVPAVLAFEHRQPHALAVSVQHDLITVGFTHLPLKILQVHDGKRWKAGPLCRVLFGGWQYLLHGASQRRFGTTVAQTLCARKRDEICGSAV